MKEFTEKILIVDYDDLSLSIQKRIESGMITIDNIILSDLENLDEINEYDIVIVNIFYEQKLIKCKDYSD